VALDGLLGYVPVAAFAALIALGLSLGTPEMLPRLFRAAIAAAVVLRIGHLWAGLGAGMASYWTASALAAGLVG
jgi:branched-subunit amino acid transport protein